MAELYKCKCGYIREIWRKGRRKWRKKGHIKSMFCPKCQNPRARFRKI